MVPLRPLTLGDFFDGAFTTIRRNPRATVGLAALVTAGFMVVPALVAIVLGRHRPADPGSTPTGDRRPRRSPTPAITTGQPRSRRSSASWPAIVVTGLVMPVVTRAVLGRTAHRGRGLAAGQGRLLRLLGLALLDGLVCAAVVGVPVLLVVLLGVGRLDSTAGLVLVVLLGLLVVLLALCAALAIHVRWFLLAAPTLVLERRGVFASLRRGSRLSRGQFWRLLGIFLLAFLATVIVSQVIAVPFALLGAGLRVRPARAAGHASALLLALQRRLRRSSGAIIGPFTGASRRCSTSTSGSARRASTSS